MLKELNSVAHQLLGLHGYPVMPLALSAPPRPLARDTGAEDLVSQCARRAHKAFVVAKVAFGPSAMGHVFW